MLTTKQEHRNGSIYCYIYKYQKDDNGKFLLKEKKKKTLIFRIDIPHDHKKREWKEWYSYRIMNGNDDISTISAVVATASRLSKQWRDNGEYTRFGKLDSYGRC